MGGSADRPYQRCEHRRSEERGGGASGEGGRHEYEVGCFPDEEHTWAISQKMGHRHHFFIMTELLHVAYQKIATYK